MAAIIAQMTRANRERKKTKKINIMKCMYDLPRFDSHFETELHNKYFRAKKRCRENHAAIQFHKLVIDRLEDIVQEQEEQRSTFDRRTCMIEGLIIGLSLALVPILAIAVMLVFPDDLEVCRG